MGYFVATVVGLLPVVVGFSLVRGWPLLEERMALRAERVHRAKSAEIDRLLDVTKRRPGTPSPLAEHLATEIRREGRRGLLWSSLFFVLGCAFTAVLR